MPKTYEDYCKYINSKWIRIINEKFYNDLKNIVNEFEKNIWIKVKDFTLQNLQEIFNKYTKIWIKDVNRISTEELLSWKSNKDNFILIMLIIFYKLKKATRQRILDLYKWDIEIYETLRKILWITEDDENWDIINAKIKNIQKLKETDNPIVQYYIESQKSIEEWIKDFTEKSINWTLWLKIMSWKSIEEKFNKVANKEEIDKFIKSQLTESKLIYNIPKYMTKIIKNKEWTIDWIANLLKEVYYKDKYYILKEWKLNKELIEIIIKLYAINSEQFYKDWYEFTQKLVNWELWKNKLIDNYFNLISFAITYSYYFNLILTAWLASYWKLTINELNSTLLKENVIAEKFHIEDWILSYPDIKKISEYKWNNPVIIYIREILKVVIQKINVFIDNKQNLEN